MCASDALASRPAPLQPARAAYLRRIRRQQWAVWLGRVTLLGLVLGAWELSAWQGWVNAFVTSRPSLVVATLLAMAEQGQLWGHLWTTMWETVAGFLLGTLLGIALASVLWWSPYVSRVVEPYLVVLNAIPKVALGPLFIVWIGTNSAAIVAMALAISLIVTVLMIFTAFQQVDPLRIRLLRSFGATQWQVWRLVVLPATVPTMLAALKVNMGLSFVGVITGEFLVGQRGLGYLIIYGGQVFNLSLVMSSIVILTVLSALLYGVVSLLERELNRRRGA